jgi:hypothetical protein
VAALALALGSAAVVSGGDDGGEPDASLDPAAGPIAADSPVAPGQPADQPTTVCEWVEQWLDADARGDQEGRDRAVAGLAEIAVVDPEGGRLQDVRQAELYMEATAALRTREVAAGHADSCGG